MRKGFTIAETMIVLMIIAGFAAVAGWFFADLTKLRSEASVDRGIFELQRGVDKTFLASMDSFSLSSGIVVKAFSSDADDYIALKKNEWIPMLSVMNNAGVIAETTANGAGVKGDGTAIADTQNYINKLKTFWNFQGFTTDNVPYIFIAQKFFRTAQGTIPYNDVYVLLMPPQLNQPLKTNKALRDRVFNTILKYKATSCAYKASGKPIVAGEQVVDLDNCTEDIDTTKKLSDAVNGGMYVDLHSLELDVFKANMEDIENMLQAGGDSGISYIKPNDFVALRSDIKLIKSSNKETMLKNFDDTVNYVKKLAKGAKDWASIEMNMYENTVAKIGGSFNIDYFITNTDSPASGKYSSYMLQSLYSGSALAKVDCRTNTEADVCWDLATNKLKITNKKASNMGMAIENFVYSNDLKTQSSFNRDAVKRPSGALDKIEVGDTIVDVTLADGLMDGAKTIIGVKAGSAKGYGSSFGDIYRYGFTNLAKYEIGIGGNKWEFEQNVPDDEKKYAPFSAVFNVTFPWIYFENKPDDNFFGYYEERIVPELR